MKTRSKVLIFSFTSIIIFTTAVLYINYSGHEVSDALVAGFYAAFTTELWALSRITINKKKDEKEDEADG